MKAVSTHAMAGMLLLLSAIIAAPALAANERSTPMKPSEDLLHVFIEHGVLFATTGTRILELDLASGALQIQAPGMFDYRAQVSPAPDFVAAIEDEDIVWVGSLPVARISGQPHLAETEAQTVRKVGGSWVLTAAYIKWQVGQDKAKQGRLPADTEDDFGIASTCSGELTSLIRAVYAAIAACEDGGSSRCNAALAELERALNNFIRCFEKER
jgi:hypothetical protein